MKFKKFKYHTKYYGIMYVHVTFTKKEKVPM